MNYEEKIEFLRRIQDLNEDDHALIEEIIEDLFRLESLE